MGKMMLQGRVEKIRVQLVVEAKATAEQVVKHLALARAKKKNLSDGSALSMAAASVYISTTDSTNRAASRVFIILCY